MQNEIASYQAALQEEANYHAAEANYIADQARRDNNIANAISTVQRHNTNKMLKSIKGSLDK